MRSMRDMRVMLAVRGRLSHAALADGLVAQRIERLTHNRRDLGSNPSQAIDEAPHESSPLHIHQETTATCGLGIFVWKRLNLLLFAKRAR